MSATRLTIRTLLASKKRSFLLSHGSWPLSSHFSSSSSSSRIAKNVTVLGASGGIGQPLSLLLKQHPELIAELRLYDITNAAGVAADISHIDTKTQVTGFVGLSQLPSALRGSNLVIVPAGVPRKPGMTRDDLFTTNAGIVYGLAASCAEVCHENTVYLVISNPVNSTVPIFVESLRRRGVRNPERRVIGVTALDSQRASAFLGASLGVDPAELNVPVIGGHSGPTIVPLLSRVPNAHQKLSRADRDALVRRIQFAGDEVVAAKAGLGSATLSMALAAVRTALAVLSASSGQKIQIPGFVACDVMKQYGLDYFATNLFLNHDGSISQVEKIENLNQEEKELLDKCIPQLKSNIEAGINFASSK